jgi:hypothetical protein
LRQYTSDDGSKARVVDRRADRRLPPHIEPDRLGGLPVGVVTRRLQRQHRGHLRGRQRRPAHPGRREQVRVVRIREHLRPVRGQEPEHATRRHQMTGQRRRIQKLPVRPLKALHRKIIPG